MWTLVGIGLGVLAGCVFVDTIVLRGIAIRLQALESAMYLSSKIVHPSGKRIRVIDDETETPEQ